MEQPEEEHPTKKNYRIHANNVDELFDYQVKKKSIIAKVSGNGRYHGFDGNGALKYDPVKVTAIPLNAISSLQKIRSERWNPSDKIIFEIKIGSGCEDLSHKIMMVPSIGCPDELRNIHKIQQLLWVQSARYRPTFLLVHDCEIEEYLKAIGGVLRDVGVGLVAWECGVRFGFGLSRLAAQKFAMILNDERLRVVLCDVNVTDKTFPKGKSKPEFNSKLEDGYDTDKQDESDLEGESGFELNEGRKRKLLYAAGKGAGKPSVEYDNDNTIKRKKKKASFDKGGRPIEQVAIVRPELQYDPRFITSSEDSDIQAAFLARLNVTDVKEFKRDACIEKVELIDFRTDAYVVNRDEYLSVNLRHEDDYFIQYTYNKKVKIVKVGELAEVIANQHGKKPWDIRSLIIEKILLKQKRNVD